MIRVGLLLTQYEVYLVIPSIYWCSGQRSFLRCMKGPQILVWNVRRKVSLLGMCNFRVTSYRNKFPNPTLILSLLLIQGNPLKAVGNILRHVGKSSPPFKTVYSKLTAKLTRPHSISPINLGGGEISEDGKICITPENARLESQKCFCQKDCSFSRCKLSLRVWTYQLVCETSHNSSAVLSLWSDKHNTSGREQYIPRHLRSSVNLA